MEQFLAAKEQISICGSVINDWVAEQILEQRDAFLTPTLAEWRRRLDRVAEWIAGEDRLAWVRPAGGVVAFPSLVTDPPGGTAARSEDRRVGKKWVRTLIFRWAPFQ